MRGNKARNPVLKMQQQLMQLEKTFTAVLDSVGDPEFLSRFEELRNKQMEEKSNQKNLSEDTKKVIKLLSMYPGFSGDVLKMINEKIAEYRNLGVLEKAQEEKKAVAKRKVKEKAPESE